MKTLKELRTDYGLTQKELGDLFKVSSRTIQNMEKDSTNIKDSLLSKYMSAFNVKYDDIFLGNEYENFVFTNDKKKSIMEKGISIRRENQDVYGILPTNLQRYQCLVVSRHYKKKRQTAAGRWQPSADDLIADDWILDY